MSKYLTAARDELNYLLENYVGRDVPAPTNVYLDMDLVGWTTKV